MQGIKRITRIIKLKPAHTIQSFYGRTTVKQCGTSHFSSVASTTKSSTTDGSTHTPDSSINDTHQSSQPTATSRMIDVVLGLALGVTVYQSARWLLDWPEPMPTLQTLINDDMLVREHIGDPPKLSWFWTGTIIPQSNFSVAIPISGSKGKGTVYARGVYDSKSRSWKLVYFQCSIHPLLQKHSLDIPQSMEIGIESSPSSPDVDVAPRSPLVMPANFDPTLLNKDQFVKYQEFLFKHGLKEWKPNTVESPSLNTSSPDSSINQSSDHHNGQIVASPVTSSSTPSSSSDSVQ